MSEFAGNDCAANLSNAYETVSVAATDYTLCSFRRISVNSKLFIRIDTTASRLIEHCGNTTLTCSDTGFLRDFETIK